jgi:hypothetical protein
MTEGLWAQITAGKPNSVTMPLLILKFVLTASRALSNSASSGFRSDAICSRSTSLSDLSSFERKNLVASLEEISLLCRRVVHDGWVLSGTFDCVPQNLFLIGTG